jgi:hypothetical protein
VKVFRFLFIALGAVILILAVAWFGGPFFLGSDICRHWINRSLNRSLQTEGTLGRISASGGALYSADYTGKGQPKTHVASFQAKDLSARPNWLRLFSGVCDFNDVLIKNVDLTVGTPAPDTPNGQQPEHHSLGIKLPSFIHPKLDVHRVSVNQIDVHWSAGEKPAEITGMQAAAVHRGNKQWDLSANGGTLNANGWPTFQIDQAAGSYQSAAITVSQAKLVAPTGGSIAVNGSVDLEGKRPYKFHGDLAGLSLSEFPPTKWHLQGLASGSVDFTGDLAEPNSGQIVGAVHLDKAKLDWSLLFGKVRSLVKQLGLNDWQLDSVDVQLNRQGQHFEFSNLSVKYQDLFRVEGGGTIEGDQIKANLVIGLSSTLLGWLPGVQQKVFTEQRDGLYWAQMQVTGPMNDPKEDLSKRISDALAEGMSNQLKNQAKSLLDLLGR